MLLHIRQNKDILIILTGRISQIILTVISLRIMTEYISPQEFARLGLILSILAILIYIFIYPVGMYINRHLLGWNEQGKVKEYLYYFSLYTLAISLISSFIIFLLHKFLDLSIEISGIWLISLTILYILSFVGNQTIIPAFNLLNYRLNFVNLTLLTLLANFLISLICIHIFQSTMEYWLVGQILGYGLLTVIAWLILRKKITPHKVPIILFPTALKISHPIVIFAIPLSLSIGLNWVQLQSYKFILAHDGGLTTLGLFLAGYGISSAIFTAFENILNQYYLPIFYKNIPNATIAQQAQVWHQYAMLLIPLSVVTLIFTIFASPYLVNILLADTFKSAQQFIIWGALVETLRVISNCIMLSTHAVLNTKTLLLPNFIGALSVISLLLLFKPYIEPSLLAGLSLTIGSSIFIIFLYFYLRRYIKLYISFQPIITSLVLSIPIIIFFEISKAFIFNLNFWYSITIVIIVGLYYMIVQFLLYQQWQKTSSNQVKRV